LYQTYQFALIERFSTFFNRFFIQPLGKHRQDDGSGNQLIHPGDFLIIRIHQPCAGTSIRIRLPLLLLLFSFPGVIIGTGTDRQGLEGRMCQVFRDNYLFLRASLSRRTSRCRKKRQAGRRHDRNQTLAKTGKREASHAHSSDSGNDEHCARVSNAARRGVSLGRVAAKDPICVRATFERILAGGGRRAGEGSGNPTLIWMRCKGWPARAK